MSIKDSMNIFRLRKYFIVFLSLLFLAMFGLQLLSKNKQDPVSASTYFLLSEIQTAGVNFHKAISSLIQKYFFLLDLREENKALKKQNQELKTHYQNFKEILKENKRLKKLMSFPLNQKLQLLPAQVVGTDFLSKNELLTVNKGSSQGVKKFMGVLHPEGVVGYIFRVSPHSSQVISLLNPLSSLPARNQNNRITGLIEAGKGGLLLFNYLDRKTFKNKNSLKVGDNIVTIKSEQFPPGFLVGNITSLNFSSQELNPIVHVKPAVPFYSLEEVLIVLNTKHQYFSEEKQINKFSFFPSTKRAQYDNKK